ncbi:uncharacterized protein LOC134821203 isoform X1 [Bolinopsis microptera]|uniref:uncharacterized protein LOC134821203 isoform X1 n=2 Tax=Bolinopsis microptera TaxID=2820187 RepID=UPI00307A571E
MLLLLIALLLGAGFLEVHSRADTRGTGTPLNAIRICQGDTTSLVCPEGRVLKIYTAQYGRFVSGQESCPHKSVRYLTDYNCISDVTPWMEMQCDNKKECVVKATNRNLGDPCKGIYKHLDIEFYCDLAPPLSTTPPLTTERQSLSKQVEKCTKLYTSILDSDDNKECDALQAYKDCLLSVEAADPSSAADIDRVMPTLNGDLESCYSASRQPLVMLCKHAKLKGECINITQATSQLEEFDNAVKSLKVFTGNWALFSEANYSGTEDRVKPGFTSHWLGIYAPIEGEPISLYSNDLSSLKPVGEVDAAFIYEYTDTTLLPTSDYNTDVKSTPDYSGISYSYSEPAKPSVTTAAVDPTDAGYSNWVNLDDISTSKHPDMCRSTYCLLGIRVIFSQIRSVTLPTRQTVEDIILSRLLNVYKIYPEQLVLAEIVKRSSEVILEIIDMKGAPRRVIDIAIEIEEDIKHEEFTFTLGDTMIIPTSDRYGVMLKTISEEFLPKRIHIVTKPITDAEVPSSTVYTTENNKVETLIPEEEPEEPTDNSFEGLQDTVIETYELDASGIPRKFFYPLLATALLLFVIACVIVSTVVYKCAQSKDYTLIKKAPSNIYIDIDSPPEKKIEGFENPSYLLEEVEHM